jgi:hypothetical protein
LIAPAQAVKAMTYKSFKGRGSFSALSSAAEEAQHLQAPSGSAESVPSDLGDHGANAKPREVTTLERRVLAHERILQTLISHLAENDPDIFEQLNTRFGAAYDLGAHEQDYVTTSHYCEYFLSNIQQQLSERHMANARQALASMSQCTGRAAVVLDELAAEEQALLQEERIEGGGLAVSTTLRKTAYFQILRSDHIMLTSTQPRRRLAMAASCKHRGGDSWRVWIPDKRRMFGSSSVFKGP